MEYITKIDKERKVDQNNELSGGGSWNIVGNTNNGNAWSCFANNLIVKFYL